eukprot:m51a1_g1245 putative protein (340) ;mRNA; r:160-2263
MQVGAALYSREPSPILSELPSGDDLSETAAVPPAYIWDVYDQLESLGEGAYGTVNKAKHKKTGRVVALKRVRMESEQEGLPISAVREITLLRRLRHPNIITLFDVRCSAPTPATRHRGSVYMVLEYVENDLEALVESGATRWLSQSQVKCIARQMLEGVAYMHSQGVIHRDIKGTNLLLGNDGVLKVCDFGLSRRASAGDMTNRVVTLWYRPPELLMGAQKYTSAVDMWSCGCVLAELLTGRPLFPYNEEPAMIDHVFRMCGTPTLETWPDVANLSLWSSAKLLRTYPGHLRDHLKALPSDAVDLIAGLLQVNPAARLSAAQALECAWLRSEPLPTRRA